MTAAPPTRRRRPRMDERLRARRAEVARARARRRRRVLASVVALAVLAGLAVAVARSPLFDIADVTVAGVDGDRADEVRAAAGILPGGNLLEADLQEAATRVAALPWVRDASARRVPPSTIRLSVAAREPVAVVWLEDSAWLVDAEQVVVAGGARDDLVEIHAPNSVLPGAGVEVRDAAVRNAMAVHAQLPGPVRGLVRRYDANSDRDLRLWLQGGSEVGGPPVPADGVWVRFGVADRVDDKAEAVVLLLEQVAAQQDRHDAAEDAERDEDPQDPAAADDAAEDPAPEPVEVAEIDVRVPDNPVLVPAGDQD